jgi:LytS/YehU family sensor histidine kinase
MILQPLFENAIKHGVYESLEPVTITMLCALHNNELIIEIQNNFDPDQQGRIGAGLGLKNIQSRLNIIYGKDNLLNWSRTGNIFKVSLRIPVR